jgi:hypothetical protein
MKKGIIEIFRYYSSGIGLIYIIYLLFGHSNVQTFSPYHYAIILMYFSCIIWLLYTVLNFFLKNKKTTYHKTLIFLNLSIVFYFTLWVTSSQS